jgi:hypothetical protein
VSYGWSVSARKGPNSPNAKLLAAALDPRHDYETLREMAREMVTFAVHSEPTQRLAAESLGVHLRTLTRWLTRWPELKG